MSSWSMPSPETPIAADQGAAAIDRHRPGKIWMPLASAAGSDSGCSAAACRRPTPRMKPTWADDVVDDQRRLQPGREGVELGDRARERARRPADLAVREIGPRDVADRARSVKAFCPVKRGRIAEEGARSLATNMRHVRVGIGRAIAAAAMRAGEEQRRARLLQRHVDAEDRRVGRADHAEHRAVGVDHARSSPGRGCRAAGGSARARALITLNASSSSARDLGGGQRLRAVGARSPARIG